VEAAGIVVTIMMMNELTSLELAEKWREIITELHGPDFLAGYSIWDIVQMLEEQDEEEPRQ
jgi:hypothetical protein